MTEQPTATSEGDVEDAVPAEPTPPEPAVAVPAEPTSALEEPATAVEPEAAAEAEAEAEATAEPHPDAGTGTGTGTGTDASDGAGRPAPRPRPAPGPGSAPASGPTANPGQRAGRRGPRPPAPGRPAVAVRPPSDPTPWGRVAEDGTVFVRTAGSERAIGTVVDATEEAALAHFGREFDALVAQVDLQEQRLMAGEVAPGEVVGVLRTLRSSLEEVSAVGDLDALAQRTRDLEAMAAVRRAEADAARAAAREEALALRSAFVAEAEEIAATDPERMQWRPTGERLRELLDAWKDAQRGGTRLEKKVEDELWKRFSAARTSFDRARRAWFAQLEEHNTTARTTKEALVAEAEALSSSTAWGPTSTAYRELMDRWKAAGRTSRKDDDALWVRFRAAQDAFFSARTAANAEEDAEQRSNLEVKEALLVEAEALLPVRDVRSARAALRGVQERWEAAGRVPRADLGRLEGRLRAVEQAVAGADQARWRGNPETRARAQGAVDQLERAVATLEADLAAARERGDARAAEHAESSLDARRQWLAAARRTAGDLTG